MSTTYYQVCPVEGIVGVFTTGVNNIDFILALPQGHHLWLCQESVVNVFMKESKKRKQWYRHFVSWDDMTRWGYGTPDRFSWQAMDNVPEILQLALLIGE